MPMASFVRAVDTGTLYAAPAATLSPSPPNKTMPSGTPRRRRAVLKQTLLTPRRAASGAKTKMLLHRDAYAQRHARRF